jgi:GNAT superfamily N-acetyltransferase
MMQIRRGGPGDARAIAEVHVRTWKAAYPGLVPQDYLDRLRPEDRIGQWEQALGLEPWPVVLVGEEDGLVVGFSSAGPAGDDDLDTDAVGAVHTLYVDPARHGRGAGAVLLHGATEQLRLAGFRSATLWVLGTNTPARGFYEHLGWSVDGATKLHDWVAFTATDVRYAHPLR